MRRCTRASNVSISNGTSRAPSAPVPLAVSGVGTPCVPVPLAGSGAGAPRVSGGTFTGTSEGAGGDDSDPDVVVSGVGGVAAVSAGEVVAVPGGGGDPLVEAGSCSWARATNAATQQIRATTHARFIGFPPPAQPGPLDRSAAGHV